MNRILNDVSDDVHCVLVIAQHTIEVASLPQNPSSRTLPMKCRLLLEDPSELFEIRPFLSSFHQHVNVIGHQAVRYYRKA